MIVEICILLIDKLYHILKFVFTQKNKKNTPNGTLFFMAGVIPKGHTRDEFRTFNSKGDLLS